MVERIAIVGSGAIASGIAAAAIAAADSTGPVFALPIVLCARSAASAERSHGHVARLLERLEIPFDERAIRFTSDAADLADASFVIEAIAEDPDAKFELFASLARLIDANAIVASTTSALSIEDLAAASAAPERFVGLHVFNPVTRMELVELVFPAAATADTRARARALCEALGKTAIEVPNIPGFVVNRLLFPFLFGAVDLAVESGLDPAAIDACLQLGAGHPLGPLAVLDLVGIDVAIAISERIGVPAPARLHELVAQGALGRKAGRGFHRYE
jgi:3-hydroxybutyryl-CoA dehydrogenase